MFDNIWHNISTLPSKSYTCGYCGEKINSNTGYFTKNGPSSIGYNHSGFIYICHNCNKPTYISFDEQIPSAKYGKTFDNQIFEESSKDIFALYNETINCMGVGAYSAVGMCCRKLLMHIAVRCGADENQSFSDYVKYLDDNNYIPSNCKGWVDIIRRKGNDTNHQIIILSSDDARQLIDFISILLTVIYEMPFQAKEYLNNNNN